MEPKYFAEEVIRHPNHPLTFGDWIPRECAGKPFFLVFSTKLIRAIRGWKGPCLGSIPKMLELPQGNSRPYFTVH